MAQAEMHGKICLVTGANAGIGKATATALARRGATVVMVCRDQARGEAAMAEVRAESGNGSVTLLLADLASQASIRCLASTVQETCPRFHVLINNAGVARWRRSVTAEGIETMFAVNYLAPFLLTNLLIERLKESAPARIINVASAQHHPLDFADLQHQKRFSGVRAYGRSKFAMMLFTYELAKRLQGTGVTVNCLSPGVAATNLARDMPLPFRLMTRLLFGSPENAAQTSLYLASSPAVAGITGKYFDRCKEAKTSAKTCDTAASQRLWDISATLTQLTVADR